MVHKCWFTLRIQILVNFYHIFVSFGQNQEIFQENCNFLEEISWSLISCFLVFYQEMCNSNPNIQGVPIKNTFFCKQWLLPCTFSTRKIVQPTMKNLSPLLNGAKKNVDSLRLQTANYGDILDSIFVLKQFSILEVFSQIAVLFHHVLLV